VPALVMKGQVWRLVTWVITPPETLSIFTIIMLLFYYNIGTLLERTIGTFLYNVYIIGGLLITMVGIMLTYIFCHYVINYYVDFSVYVYMVSTYYIATSLFLAVAACYPNMEILYAMIIPIKMKWMSVFYLAITAYYFYYSSFMGRVNILLSLLNFFIFFLSTKNMRRFSPKQIKRKRAYTKQVKSSDNIGHKCCICGITDKDNPDMTFRYCSKCSGNREYCTEHLFTHTHVK
jgi:hypothetical protein